MLALMVCGALVSLFTRERAIRRWILIGIIGVAVSSTGAFLRSTATDTEFSGTYLATGTITGDAVVKSSRVVGQAFINKSATLPVRIENLRSDREQINLRLPVRLMIQANESQFTPGSRLQVEIRFIKKIRDGWLAQALARPRLIESAGIVARGAQRIRTGLGDAAAHLPKPAGGLLPGLVVGDTSQLDPRLESQMRATNLTHLTAVSGANLALVAAFVIFLLRIAGVSRLARPWLTAVAIAGFVIVARPDPSVLRAAVMAGVLIIAAAFELPGLGLTALMVAVIVLILIDPSQAQRPGFVLSVLATAGLLLFASPWARRLERYFPRWLALSLAVPLAAQALCTPYLVLISGQLSLIGIWSNLLVAPAIAPITILGFLAAVISVIFPALALLVAWLSFLPLWWVSAVAHIGSAMPFANIRWPSGWTGVLLSTALIVATYFGIRWRARIVIAIYLALLILLATLRTFTPLWPMHHWAMAMCDVGQGDGLVIRASKDSALVIDAGPSPELMDRCLRDLGITKIPLVILTHNHADHVEGLPGVLRGRNVGRIWISPEVEPEFESKRVSNWVKGLDVVSVPIEQPVRFPNVEITALWPKESIREGSIPNNSSVVILARWPSHAALFLGDVEVQAQERLRLKGPFDIVKVAHHGSGNQDFSLLSDLDPTVALISVGAINPYGHPNSKTLRALNLSGATIYRSDRDGSVAVAFAGRGMEIAARGHPWWRQ